MNDVIIYQNFPTTDELKNLQVIAATAMKSGLYGGSAEKILMTLLSARELNIGPMMALNGGIWNIQGKVELSARLMAALIRRGGHSVTVIECNNTKCIIEGKRKDTGDTFTASFTMEDATAAGLAGGSSWKKYAEDMLYARALSRLARRLFPDIIGNCYVEGEIAAEKKKSTEPENLPLAESDVVNATNEEETPSDSESDTKKRFEELISKFHNGDVDLLRDFVVKWTKAHQKGYADFLNHFADSEKLKAEFGAWKEKQQA